MRDVNETDERGRTLLYVACRNGALSFARRALELSSGDTVNFTNVAGKHELYAAAAISGVVPSWSLSLIHI